MWVKSFQILIGYNSLKDLVCVQGTQFVTIFRGAVYGQALGDHWYRQPPNYSITISPRSQPWEGKRQINLQLRLLLGLSNYSQVQVLFSVILLVYLISLVVSVLLILLICLNQLHSLLHFFHSNLSFLITCYCNSSNPHILTSMLTPLWPTTFPR